MQSQGRRVLKVVVQAAVALAGVALLGWAVMAALSPENREKLGALREASPWAVAALCGLSLATQGINGLIFWGTLLPVRRLRATDVLAINALCTFLQYMPFKIGALLRVLIHNRRDRVPLLTIGAWFGSMALVMILACTPPVVASLVLKRIDGAWAAATIGGEVVLAALIVLTARVVRGERGEARLHRVFAGVRMPFFSRLLRTRLWRDLRTCFDILGDGRAVGGTVALRVLDVVVQAVRFWVAAGLLGVELPVHAAVVLSLAYFGIGIVSPFVVGLREAGVMKLAALMLPAVFSGNGEAFAPVPLLVTATEAVVFLGAAGVGLAWLGPRRLLGLRALESRETPQEPA